MGRVRGIRSPQELDLGSTLQRLSAKDQAILVLRFVEDRTSDEVGALAATVRTRARRALQRLRKELENDG